MYILTSHTKMGLRFIDAWPGTISSKRYFIMIIAIGISLIFQWWDTAIIFRKLNLLMYNLGTTIPVTSALLKLIVFRQKYRVVKLVVKELLEDWENRKEHIEKNVILKNSQAAIYLCNTISICYIMPVIAYLVIAILSLRAESISDRKFTFHANFPESAKKSPAFEILCFLQFIIGVFVSGYHAVLEALLITLVLHANTKAMSVCKEVRKFTEICQSNNSKSCILKSKKSLIERHLNFITYTEHIRDIYEYISFVHLFLIILINCIVGYMLINFSNVSEDNGSTTFLCIVYILTCLLAIGSYCIAGEFLTFQGTLIFNEICNCPWYNFKMLDAKILIFMIMRSRQPVTISVGSFGNLSLIYFTQIMKTSISFLSLIRASSI